VGRCQRPDALHPDKTRIVEAQTEAFDFLGYRFDRGRRLVRPKTLAKLKEAVRAKTKRTDGHSLACRIASVNRTLKGWFVYFRRCEAVVFSSLDGWIRRRLRSLLRKHQGRKGISRHGEDERRWPNAFFAEQGLFSVELVKQMELTDKVRGTPAVQRNHALETLLDPKQACPPRV
jgi:RNA-directed DNA polymerase